MTAHFWPKDRVYDETQYEGWQIDRDVMPGWIPPAPIIGRDISVMVFGSCFAQHIEDHLRKAGYRTPEKSDDAPWFVRHSEEIATTAYLRSVLRQADTEERRLLDTIGCFIVSLGLADRRGQLITVEETLADLRDIRALLAPKPLVLTLSPIPLAATFRPISAITANCVSKALLRVALDHLMADGLADTYYFPSYEMVTSYFTEPWDMPERSHPEARVIRAVMETFERHYCHAQIAAPM